MNDDILIKAKELLEPLAQPHKPEGSTVEALVDQWLHAIATDSDFFAIESLGHHQMKI